MRKNPKQARAQQTIDDISEAATQVLDGEDKARFTTNHIAERAGISIGTLYRYFPDKRSILRFIVRREIAKTSERVLRVISQSGANDAQTLIANVVDASLTSFEGKRRVRRHFVELAQNDPEIVAEMTQLRLSILLQLNARLSELEPDKYGPLSKEAQTAAGEAFKAASLALDKQDLLYRLLLCHRSFHHPRW